jgi:hypothetical protein
MGQFKFYEENKKPTEISDLRKASDGHCCDVSSSVYSTYIASRCPLLTRTTTAATLPKIPIKNPMTLTKKVLRNPNGN